jgi:adenylate kinase
MGPPGVGKGTQSLRLSKWLGIPIVGSGDMFRAIRQEDTPLSEKVRSYMDKGEYVPDNLTIEMVLNRLHQPDVRYGFILDGFPRTVAQAEALDQKFGDELKRIDHVILLDAPMNVVLKRMFGRWVCSKCGHVYNEVSHPPKTAGMCDVCESRLVQRSDEDPEIQRNRLQVYEKQTAPVLDYYRDQKRLEEVDAQLPADVVTKELRDIIMSPAEKNGRASTRGGVA